MKRFFSIMCAVFLTIGTTASAYTPATDVSYFFAGERYGISNIDTNGEVFVGVNQNKLAVSHDFANWDTLYQLDDVAAVQYLGGQFCAFTKGYTYVSENGDTWEKLENNLQLIPDKDKIIKNNGSVVLFAHNEDWSGAGTYQSFDGINWRRVENIPDGITMNIVNGQIMFESAGYMRGIYYSDTGEEFTCLNIEGYDDSSGFFRISYNGSEYVLYDYWREVDGSTEENRLLYRYSSPDFVGWQSEIVSMAAAGNVDSYGWIEPSGSVVNINGEWNSFSQNGYNHVYRDGKWEKGEYYGITGLNETNQPFVYYNFTDYGIFMWSTNHNAAFIKNSGEVIKYNGQERNIASFFVKDGKFVGQNWLDGQWESENGKNWTKTELKDDYSSYYRQVKATNGTSSFESEIIERGSWRFHEDNKEITGTLTEADGDVKKVVFENTKHSDFITAYSGNGYYLLGDYDRRFWISHDGITRDEYIYPDDLESAANLYANDKSFIITTQAGIQYVGDMSQFEKIPANDAIKVKLSGEYLSFEVAPVIENSRTLVPMRFILEKMGALVGWSDELKIASILYGESLENYIEIQINSNIVKVNGIEKPLDVPARLINDKTMLPLRFIAEEMGYTVNYIPETKTAEIAK